MGLCGGILMQVLSGLASAYSIYMLASAARRTGDTSFTALTTTVLGGVASSALMWALLADLLLVIAAYLIMIRDIIDKILGEAYDNFSMCTLALMFSFPIALSRTVPMGITPFRCARALVRACPRRLRLGV